MRCAVDPVCLASAAGRMERSDKAYLYCEYPEALTMAMKVCDLFC